MRAFLDLGLVAFAIAAGFVAGFAWEGISAYLAQEPLDRHINDMLRSGAFGGVTGCFIGTIATVALLRRRRG